MIQCQSKLNEYSMRKIQGKDKEDAIQAEH